MSGFFFLSEWQPQFRWSKKYLLNQSKSKRQIETEQRRKTIIMTVNKQPFWKQTGQSFTSDYQFAVLFAEKTCYADNNPQTTCIWWTDEQVWMFYTPESCP